MIRAGLLLALSSIVLPAMSETPDTAESLKLMVGAPPSEARQVRKRVGRPLQPLEFSADARTDTRHQRCRHTGCFTHQPH